MARSHRCQACFATARVVPSRLLAMELFVAPGVFASASMPGPLKAVSYNALGIATGAAQWDTSESAAARRNAEAFAAASVFGLTPQSPTGALSTGDAALLRDSAHAPLARRLCASGRAQGAMVHLNGGGGRETSAPQRQAGPPMPGIGWFQAGGMRSWAMTRFGVLYARDPCMGVWAVAGSAGGGRNHAGRRCA